MDGLDVGPTRHKLDVSEYCRMGAAGVFADNKRIELIDGDLIDMAPIGDNHAAIVDGFCEVLVIACAGRATVRVRGPLGLDRFNDPQPDLAILRRQADFYAGRRPTATDVLLLVEVADGSLRFDRTVKLPLYARFGIAEVWIVDVSRRVVDVHRNPSGTGYDDVVSYPGTGELALAAAPDIMVRLDLVFGAML